MALCPVTCLYPARPTHLYLYLLSSPIWRLILLKSSLLPSPALLLAAVPRNSCSTLAASTRLVSHRTGEVRVRVSAVPPCWRPHLAASWRPCPWPPRTSC